MKKTLISAIMILTVMAVSCSRGGKNVVPTGWEPQNAPLDSLTRKIELAFISTADVDSLTGLVESYAGMSGKDEGGDEESLARVHFWRGRLAARSGKKTERQKEFNEALRIAPSATADYIRRRIAWLEEDMSEFSRTQWYSHLVEEAEYYDERGDAIMLCARYIELLELMRDIGFNSRARKYLDLTDSCTGVIHGGEYFPGQDLNRAAVLFDMGSREEAGKVYKKLDADSAAMADRDLFGIVKYNLYIIYRDTAALRDAYNSINGTPDDMKLMPKVAAEMASVAMSRGDLDGAVRFAGEAKRDLDIVGNSGQRLRVFRVLAEVSDSAGNDAASLRAYRDYALTADSIASLLLDNEVADLEVTTYILESDRIASERRLRKNIITVSAVVLMTVIVAVIVLLSLLRIRRLKRERRAAVEQKRRSEQQQIAVQLGAERKKQVLDEALNQLQEMKDGDEIESSRLERLEHILSAKSATELDTENFQSLFSLQNPEFIARIRQLAPNISDSALRLAGYMAIGLTTKEISDLMNVQPESVKQGRWRLRKVLGLPPDKDLKAFLSSLLKESRRISADD